MDGQKQYQVRSHLNSSVPTAQKTHFPPGARVIIIVSGHKYWWLAGDFNLEIGHF